MKSGNQNLKQPKRDDEPQSIDEELRRSGKDKSEEVGMVDKKTKKKKDKDKDKKDKKTKKNGKSKKDKNIIEEADENEEYDDINERISMRKSRK